MLEGAVLARCPSCRNTFSTDRAGHQLCPVCGKALVVPEPAPAPPGAPRADLIEGSGTPWERRAELGSQTASASIIRFVIASGCEMSARWLALISIVFAPIRLAMKRSRSGLIVRSWVDTA